MVGVCATSGVVLATLIAVCATFTLVCATFSQTRNVRGCLCNFKGGSRNIGDLLRNIHLFMRNISYFYFIFQIKTPLLHVQERGFGLSNFNPAIFDAGYYGLGAVVYIHFLKNAGYVIFYSFFGDE